VVAGLGAGIIASVTSPPRTRAWRHNFTKTVLVILIVVQYVHLARMAIVLPPGVSNSETVIYSSCRQSRKGGKPSGSFRDCTNIEGPWCSQETPCSPCDSPVAPFEFDGRLHSTHCDECSATLLGDCRFASGPGVDRAFVNKHGPFCRRLDGVVEPCALCCASGQVASARIMQLLQHDNCATVYDPAEFEWPEQYAEPEYGCVDPDFPVATRYGCCPSEAARPVLDATEEIAEALTSRSSEGTQLYMSRCMRAGPLGASWAYCEGQAAIEADNATNPASLLQAHTRELLGGLGCPVYSNGVYISHYCRLPVLHNATTLTDAPSLP
jgi:hypothetical protein